MTINDLERLELSEIFVHHKLLRNSHIFSCKLFKNYSKTVHQTANDKSLDDNDLS